MFADGDLMKYFLKVLNLWKIIFSLVFVIMLCTFIFTLLQPSEYTAVSEVLILPSQSNVTLDARFVTNNASLATDVTSRRNALVALAQNYEIAKQVNSQLPEEFSKDNPNHIANMISTSIMGDLLSIKVTSVNKTEAETISTLWVNAYVTMINRLYSQDDDLINDLERQKIEAQKNYDLAQLSLEDFIENNNIIETTNQISVTSLLLQDAELHTTRMYSQYMQDIRDIDLLLTDFQTLHELLLENGGNDVADKVAIIGLKNRIAEQYDSNINLELANLDLLDSIDASPESIANTIDSLIKRKQFLSDKANLFLQNAYSAYTNDAETSNKTSQDYIRYINSLTKELETQKSQYNILLRARNTALETLNIIQNKIIERKIAHEAPNTQVRYISTMLKEPASPIKMGALYSAIVGFISFTVIVLVVLLYVIGKDKMILK